MNAPNNRSVPRWLSHRQLLLLTASLHKGQDAAEAWTSWSDGMDLDRLDPSSAFLLAKLYANLQPLKLDGSALMDKLKGVYRHTWAKNATLAGMLIPGLRAVRNAGIEVMIIKGVALSVLYYKDAGVRRMMGTDILVPFDKAKAAVQILRENGWTPRLSVSDEMMGVRHCAELFNKEGVCLNLHWHLLLECCAPGADDDFWQAAVPATLNELQVSALCPADQLLHTCVYGLSGFNTPPLRWVTDAWMILETCGPRIEWARLIQQAEKRRLVVPVREALSFLGCVLGADIPQNAIDELGRIPVAPGERLEHFLKFRGQKFLGRLPLWWFSWRRLNKSGKGIGFPRYLQYSFGLKNLGQVPDFMISAGI